jgi:Mrp family chromosome partitioning ATPase
LIFPYSELFRSRELRALINLEFSTQLLRTRRDEMRGEEIHVSKTFESIMRAGNQVQAAAGVGPLDSADYFGAAAPSPASTPVSARVGAVRDPIAAAETPLDQETLKLVQRLFLLQKATRLVTFAGLDREAGCSWMMARVARMLAVQVEGTVCVVDANLRSPSLHNVFQTSNEMGLSEALISAKPIADYAQQLPERRLSVITSGAGRSVAQGVVTSECMRQRMAELREHFDYVLIDTPPLNLYPDAFSLGHWSDGLALVLCADSTLREQAKRIIKELHASNVPLLGAVLNREKSLVPRAISDRL